jgi:hypothetical protein
MQNYGWHHRAYQPHYGGQPEQQGQTPLQTARINGAPMRSGIVPTALTPHANLPPRGRRTFTLPENVNFQNLTVDFDIGTQRSYAFADADRGVLMALAAAQKKQCEPSGWTGKGWLCVFIVIVLLVIVGWIIIALCTRNKKGALKNCCKRCGQEDGKCRCRKRKSRKCRRRPSDCEESDSSNASDSCPKPCKDKDSSSESECNESDSEHSNQSAPED